HGIEKKCTAARKRGTYVWREKEQRNSAQERGVERAVNVADPQHQSTNLGAPWAVEQCVDDRHEKENRSRLQPQDERAPPGRSIVRTGLRVARVVPDRQESGNRDG